MGDGLATWMVTHPADNDRDSAKEMVDGHASQMATHPADTFQEPGKGTQESGSARREVDGVYGISKPEAKPETRFFPFSSVIKRNKPLSFDVQGVFFISQMPLLNNFSHLKPY